MTMCPRIMVSFVVLYAVQAFALALLFVRLYMVPHINQAWALILSIFATFVSTAETEVKQQIKESGSFLAISTAFKIIKCILTIMVFSYNGNINDYFIGMYFFFSSYVGAEFFKRSGKTIPARPYRKLVGDGSIEVDRLDNENLKKYFDRLMCSITDDIEKVEKDRNLYKLQGMSLVFFLIALVLLRSFPSLCIELLGMGDPLQSMEVTTLGYSATIMILYNMIAWPFILHMTLMNRPDISSLNDERERALALTH
jgi:hypothetical protein